MKRHRRETKRTLVTQMLIWFKRRRRWGRKIRHFTTSAPRQIRNRRRYRDNRRNRGLRRYICTHIIARSWRGIPVGIMRSCNTRRLGYIICWVVRWDRRLINMGRGLVRVLCEARSRCGRWSKLIRIGVVGPARGMWWGWRVGIIVVIVGVVVL